MRDPFLSTTAETDVSAVLEAFRDRDVHRVFIRKTAEAEKDQLTGVLTQTDLIRFLHGAQFAAKEVKQSCSIF
jgi:CBS-domain-containing membrane protein